MLTALSALLLTTLDGSRQSGVSIWFHYQLNCAERRPRWTTSGMGPKQAQPTSKRAAVTSRRPQPTGDKSRSPP